MTAPEVLAQARARMIDVWLGGEPNLLDVEVEKKGVKDIMDALSAEEMKEMKDTTMPIRHFRAEKVSFSEVASKTTYTSQFSFR